MLSNAYFVAKFRFATSENEPAKNLQNSADFPNFANLEGPDGRQRGLLQPGRAGDAHDEALPHPPHGAPAASPGRYFFGTLVGGRGNVSSDKYFFFRRDLFAKM